MMNVSSQIATFVKQKNIKTLNYIPDELGELKGPSIQEFIKDLDWELLDFNKRSQIAKKFFEEVIFTIKNDKVIIFSKPSYTSGITSMLGSSPESYYSKCGFGKQQNYTDGKVFVPFYSAPSYKEADWTTGKIKFSYWTCVHTNGNLIVSQIIGFFDVKTFDLEIDDQWKISKGLFSFIHDSNSPSQKKPQEKETKIFDVEKEEIVTDRVLGNKIPTFYHKPKETKLQRRLIIKYFEDDERYAKIIPRSISFIYQLRQKDMEGIDKEKIEAKYIIHLIKEDDVKHQSLNPLVEVLFYDEKHNTFQSIENQTFHFTKEEETILTFFVKRKVKYFAIDEYTKVFDNHQSSLDFMKTLDSETTLNVRYYDLHHHGYTLIHMNSEVPVYRTGSEKVKLLVQTHQIHTKEEYENDQKDVNIETSLMVRKNINNEKLVDSPNTDLKIPMSIQKKFSRTDTGYEKELKKVFETYYLESELQINNILPKVFPAFGGKIIEILNPSGTQALKRLMCVIGIIHPTVEYCPYLIHIISFLLIYIPEQQAYTMFKEMIEKKNFIRLTYDRNYIIIKSISSLIQQKLPKMCLYMHEKKFNIEYIILDLVNSFFLHHLSLPIVLKIFDEFMNHGYEEFYRVCYNFFCALESEVYKMESPFEMHKLFTSKHLQEDDIFKFKLVVKIEDLESKFKSQKIEPVNIVPFSRPKLNCKSSIIESMDNEHPHHLYEELFEPLPFRPKAKQMIKIFSTEKDGYILSSLYRKIKDVGVVLLLLEVYGQHLTKEEGKNNQDHSKKAIIGAFFGEPFSNHLCFEGNGETMVFSLYPKKQCYKWSKKNDYFVYGKNDSLMVGGGGKGSAIFLDELESGSSHRCTTFDNEPLCTDFIDFKVLSVEAFTFE